MYEKLLELLKEARVNKGLKQQDAAAMLGLKGNTISNWEKGRSQPDIEIFVKLCSIYGVNFSDLLNAAYGSPTKFAETMSSKETNHIKKYRALDERGQQTVDMVLNAQYELVSASKQSSASSTAAGSSHRAAAEALSYEAEHPSRAEMHRMLDEELDAAERGQTSPASTCTESREVG